MGLKVWFELAGCRNQHKGKFLHRRVFFFGTAKHSARVVYGLLYFFFFSD